MSKLMFLFWAWTWSRACCCLSWVSLLLLKSFIQASHDGQSLLIGQTSLEILQFFIEQTVRMVSDYVIISETQILSGLVKYSSLLFTCTVAMYGRYSLPVTANFDKQNYEEVKISM